MKKIFVILPLVCLIWAISVFSREIEIRSEVISVNPKLDFFIIGSGKDAGIEIGDGLIVHRNGEKIAEAYIIEVRPAVSAAEILNVKGNNVIQEGDSVLLVKRREGAYKKAGYAGVESAYVGSSEITGQGNIISIGIAKDPKAVFAYTILLLKENGYSISSSNRGTGILLATKPIPLSLFKELWADAVASINHKLVVSFEIKGKGKSSMLRVSSFKEHSQKGKYIKRPVLENSKYYNELTSLVSQIKERSER